MRGEAAGQAFALPPLEGGAHITVGATITAFANNVEVMYMPWGVVQDLASVAPFASDGVASL